MTSSAPITPSLPYDLSKVEIEIYPPIGCARVGNSEKAFFVGPELPWTVDHQERYELPSGDLMPQPPGAPPKKYKDDDKALLRQAARFRLYVYKTENGKKVCLGELLPSTPGISVEWGVHLANKKAAWYKFVQPMDIAGTPSSTRRNPNISEPQYRDKLVIDGKLRTISSSVRGPVPMTGEIGLWIPQEHRSKGPNGKEEVTLGELRTDKAGRLMVLGGLGKAGVFFPSASSIADFSNNDGWYDDIGDGPVTASVSWTYLDDKKETKTATNVALSAWVCTAPPNYAPEIVTPKTMYETISEVMMKRNKYVQDPTTTGPVSFTNDVLPIFTQLSEGQWVNAGFSHMFGFGSPFDFSDEQLLRKLSKANPKRPLEEKPANNPQEKGKPEEAGVKSGDKKPPAGMSEDPYKELRHQIWSRFRFNGQSSHPNKWPPILGDNPVTHGPDAYLTITQQQQNVLTVWKNGTHIDDYDSAHPPVLPQTIEQVADLDEQTRLLTKAPLHYMMGGAFHPGCELTWVMRQQSIYIGAYRIRPSLVSPVDSTDMGPVLSPDLISPNNATFASYPFYDQGPGDLTKWMAVPWHTDTASCRAGYPGQYNLDPAYYDPYLDTFWPSRVPNNVLSSVSFKTFNDTTLSSDERLRAFHKREPWLRGLAVATGDYWPEVTSMIKNFSALGVVVEERVNLEATTPADRLPKKVFVETGRNEAVLHQETVPARFGLSKTKTRGGSAETSQESDNHELQREANMAMFADWSARHTSSKAARPKFTLI